ncbi:MAG: OmpL47-type beta-barrel domain-containing protein [Spirochaetota bacterium]
MRKCIITTVFLLFFSAYYMHLASGQEFRIYNDGVIDYVPGEARFVLSADDAHSSLDIIQYSVDGSPLEVYKEAFSINEEGRHIVVYRAVDRAGNISPEKIYSVIVDKSPPEGLASIHGPLFMIEDNLYVRKDSMIVLWAEDALSGVDAIYVSLDDGEYVEYTSPVAITEEGFHTAKTYAIDNVGNRTQEFSVSGYVDSTPPEVAITAEEDFIVAGGEVYTNRNNEFTVSADDRGAGVKAIYISLDGSDYYNYPGPFKVQIPGLHNLRAKASDNLGNESDPVELSFYIDIIPPSTTMGVSFAE